MGVALKDARDPGHRGNGDDLGGRPVTDFARQLELQ